MLGVTHHTIRRLIKEGALAAEQVVPDAPSAPGRWRAQEASR